MFHLHLKIIPLANTCFPTPDKISKKQIVSSTWHSRSREPGKYSLDRENNAQKETDRYKGQMDGRGNGIAQTLFPQLLPLASILPSPGVMNLLPIDLS